MAGMSFFHTVTNANTVNLNVPNNYRGVLVTVDSTGTRNGAYIIYATGGGVIGVEKILEATGLTITKTTNNLAITSAGSTHIAIMNVSTYKVSIAS